MEYYKAFLKKFGDEEFFVLVFSTTNMFTRDHILEINTIAEKMKKLDGIVSVTSLADIFKDKITSSRFKEKVKTQHDRPLMNIFKQQILADPAYRNSIISQNGKTTAIIATVKSVGPELRKQLVSEIRKVLYEHKTFTKSNSTDRRNHRFHVAGPL